MPALRERRKSLTRPTTTTIRPETTTGSPADDVEILDMQEEDDEHYIKNVRRLGEDTEWASNSEEQEELEEGSPEVASNGVTTPTPSSPPTGSTETTMDYGAYVTLIPWELLQHNGKSEKLREMHESLLTKQPLVQQQQPLQQEQRQKQEQRQQQQQPLYRDEHVRVVIHNLTQISEADVQKWSTNTNAEDINYVNLKL